MSPARLAAAALAAALFAPPLAAQQSAATRPGQFALVLKQNFARWDKDKSRDLSDEEIDRAVLDPFNKGATAATLAAVRLAANNPKLERPELTLAGLIAAASAPAPTGKPDLNKLYASAYTRIEKTSRVLFPKGKPNLLDVNQGKNGDCFCLAPLGAMIARDPMELVRRIKKKSDGNFSVLLGIDNELTVPPPTDTEIGLIYASGGGLWVNVYERAMATALNDARPEEKKVAMSLDAATRGGSTAGVLKLLTGHVTSAMVFKKLQDPATPAADKAKQLDDLRAKLTAAVNEKRLVTCGTPADTVMPPGVPGKHAYAVLGYLPKADAVILWNPHGRDFVPKGASGRENGYVVREGVFQVPLAEFVQVFRGMSFETAEPSKAI